MERSLLAVVGVVTGQRSAEKQLHRVAVEEGLAHGSRTVAGSFHVGAIANEGQATSGYRAYGMDRQSCAPMSRKCDGHTNGADYSMRGNVMVTVVPEDELSTLTRPLNWPASDRTS